MSVISTLFLNLAAGTDSGFSGAVITSTTILYAVADLASRTLMLVMSTLVPSLAAGTGSATCDSVEISTSIVSAISSPAAGTDSGMCDAVKITTSIVSKVFYRRSDAVEVPSNDTSTQCMCSKHIRCLDTKPISVLW